MPEPGSEAVDMNVAVLLETAQGEKRVAAVPATVEKMVKAGMQVSNQSGGRLRSTAHDRRKAGAVLRVQRRSAAELDRMPERAAVIAYTLQANSDPELREALKRRRLTALSLDLVPRIARAQNMDVLSSMANIAGYKSVLLAANALGKFFPMLMTAAGTVVPARVLMLGAGVAGLQAGATAPRLGPGGSGVDL